MVKSVRKKSLTIRFRGSRLDDRRLAALARYYELTPSAVLRRLLSEAVDRERLTP